ncbi:MAG: SIS domain-containing protein [Spirochaetaceae bacterium]
MNTHDAVYREYAVVREMLETTEVVRDLPVGRIRELPAPVGARKPAGARGPVGSDASVRDPAETAAPFPVQTAAPFLVGEGSSRIFPAGRAVHAGLRRGDRIVPRTESAHAAAELELGGRTVYVASNSGKTAECVHLIRRLREKNHEGGIVGMAAAGDSPVAAESDDAYILTCGAEQAVAATKSVVEQALVYDIVFRLAAGLPLPDLDRLSTDMAAALDASVPVEVTRRISAAPTLYFAGRSDGVAEELALKANEIVRARSDFLPGTYAVHGIEEVMDPADVLIWIDPPRQYEAKFREVLQEGVGLAIVAIAARETSFPTIRIPAAAEPDTAAYLELAAGWNLLIEAGVSRGINIDKPERARKVGNEFSGDVS